VPVDVVVEVAVAGMGWNWEWMLHSVTQRAGVPFVPFEAEFAAETEMVTGRGRERGLDGVGVAVTGARQATGAGRSPSACRPSESERVGHRRRRAAGPPGLFWNWDRDFVLCRFSGSSCVGGVENEWVP
jgi:hypothetical protein